MAEELLQRPDLVAGKRVCELGCGLGLAGLSAALAGEVCSALAATHGCCSCAPGSSD
jgi:predicted nicotinamide N-methyase